MIRSVQRIGPTRLNQRVAPTTWPSELQPLAEAFDEVLNRLEEKSLVKSQLGEATATRGGKRKRFYFLTGAGKASLIRSKEIRDQLWQKIPHLTLKRI